MSLKSLPLLFINMEGEMMYILEQRLISQNIPVIKSQKVLNDIIAAMVNEEFVKELFRPQELYSKAALKTTFDKLAHASIMKLNSSSVDKLYDLISMAFKFQLYMCPRPSDLLLITLNHVDALKRMVNLQHIKEKIDDLYDLLIKTSTEYNEGEFQQIRYTLFNYFQDIHIRVSMFLRDQSQTPNGRFALPTISQIPVNTEIPGSIRLFNSNGDIFRIKHFQNSGQYQPASKAIVITRNGDRGTLLGTNMYNSPKSESESSSSNVYAPPNDSNLSDISQMTECNASAKKELNFLAELIGNCDMPPQNAEFRLQLFDVPLNSENLNESVENKNIQLVSPAKDNDELSKIIEDFQMCGNSQSANNDLLDLMDSTCN